MSSKKKTLKYQHAAGAAADDDGVSNTTRMDTLLSMAHYTKVGKKDQIVLPRPAHSRIVNHNSLRPHGALLPEELEVCCHHSNNVPVSLLHDIASMVNDSQILLRRSPDFAVVADPKEAIQVLHDAVFRHWWLDNVARDCVCGAMYPYTGFHFAASASENFGGVEASSNLRVESCLRTGEIIHRILCVFDTISNESRWASQELLFHMIRNEKVSVDGLLMANYNRQHITVCCGLHFYSVDVLDADGVVVSAETIAERLLVVKEHADRTERALLQQTLLPESLDDLLGFYKLLGRLTEIDSRECAKIMERLRNADPVNAAALMTIDSGIFTVVLRSLSGKASSAHWYRSALVLEEAEEDGLLKLRAHSTLIHGDELADFLSNVLSFDMKPNTTSKPEVAPCIRERDEEEKGGGEDVEEGTPDADGYQTSGVEYMEMWLPWKHRRPMQPYAVVHPLPSIFSFCISNEAFVSFACLCTSAVLAVQQVLTPCGKFPTVLVAFSNPRGGVSAFLLYSNEMEALIQSICCRSALVERQTTKHLAIMALKSVERVIDACFFEPYPKYSMAKTLLAMKKAVAPDAVAEGSILGEVDLYITTQMLGSSGKILQCETSLVLPARFAITCNTVGSLKQQHHQKSARGPSSAQVTHTSLIKLKNEEHGDLGAQLADRIAEMAQQLLSLLSM